MKEIAKNVLYKILTLSLYLARKKQGYINLYKTLKEIVPDISDQYTSRIISGEYLTSKVYSQHAFQTQIVLDEIKKKENNILVDMGDSSGNHIIYLKTLVSGLKTYSVNSDKDAIDKLQKKGLPSIHSRVENLKSEGHLDETIDLMVCFQVLEHLSDPIGFLKSVNESVDVKKFIISVPYLSRSSVRLDMVENPSLDVPFNPEVTHIFELSPEDWNKIFKFSGWRIEKSKIYYQYPRNLFSYGLKFLWKKFDFEGFYGAVLIKDDTFLKMYNNFD